MELFKLNDEFLVDLNKEWIGTIKEFKEVLTRDKDRHKKKAQREFTFIYHALDFRSQFVNYPDGDRIKESLRNADLEEDYKWEKDEKLVNAYNKYEELRLTRSLRIIRGAYIGIDKLTVYLNTMKIEEADEAKTLMTTLGGLGKLIGSIKDLEEQVKRELTEDSGIRGDKTKGFSEDPD